jgi:hypothetical protein
VAPGPASGEGASLQVGPESDWRFACCSCAPVDAITVGPPMATPTTTPVPTADWPAFWASRWGVPVFAGGNRVRAIPSGGLTVGEPALAVGLSILSSSCCCWRSTTSWRLVLFSHRSASRIFIMQPGCSPPPVVIQKDDHQPHGGEKRARLRPPPYPQLQGCSSSLLGWKASRVGALSSAWAGDPLLPPAFGGEGCSPALWRRQTSATRGRLAAGCQLQCVWPFGLDGFGAASDAASCRLAGAWLSVHRTGDGRAVHGFATSTASPARQPHWGVVQDVVRRGVAAAFLDGLVLTPVGGRERGPLRA